MVEIFSLPFRDSGEAHSRPRHRTAIKEEELTSGPSTEDESQSRKSAPPTADGFPNESTDSGSAPGTPPYPFPHRAKPLRRAHEKAPCDAAHVALRRQHISNLTTVLHTTLERQDYVRASRAWALLLRSKPGTTRSVDIRKAGRWGIGVELLLWRGIVEQEKQRKANLVGTAQSDHERGQVVGGDDEGEYGTKASELRQPSRLNRRLFEPVKEYFQRLILEYTPKARRPNALDFYPAMFTFWIQSICEEFQDLRQPILDVMSRSRNKVVDEEMEVDDREDEDEAQESRLRQDQLANLKQLYLDELTEINGLMMAMDDVVLSPPYSDDEYLVGLRRQIGAWARDTERKADEPGLILHTEA